MDVFVICIALFVGAICLMLSIPSSIKRDQEQKRESEYYKLSDKQSERGIYTRSLETAKDALSRLESEYEPIKGGVSAKSAALFEENIRDVRSNVEDLIFEKMGEKSQKNTK